MHCYTLNILKCTVYCTKRVAVSSHGALSRTTLKCCIQFILVLPKTGLFHDHSFIKVFPHSNKQINTSITYIGQGQKMLAKSRFSHTTVNFQSSASPIVVSFILLAGALTCGCKCFEEWMHSVLNPFDLVTVLVKT